MDVARDPARSYGQGSASKASHECAFGTHTHTHVCDEINPSTSPPTRPPAHLPTHPPMHTYSRTHTRVCARNRAAAAELQLHICMLHTSFSTGWAFVFRRYQTVKHRLPLSAGRACADQQQPPPPGGPRDPGPSPVQLGVGSWPASFQGSSRIAHSTHPQGSTVGRQGGG